MGSQMRIRRDPKHDMLCAEVLVQGKAGVAQIRAVAPLARIREALHRRVKMAGVTISGEVSQKCDVVALKLAGINLFRTIAKAAKAPLAQAQQSVAARNQRVLRLVEFAESGKLQECFGGWEGLQEAFDRKRQTEYNAVLARGIPDAVAEQMINRKRQEDADIIAEAKEQLGDDEGEDPEPEDDDTAGNSNSRIDPDMCDPKDKLFMRGRGGSEDDSHVGRARFRKRRAPAPHEQEESQEDNEKPASDEPVDAANPGK